jgi:hypothetical protein
MPINIGVSRPITAATPPDVFGRHLLDAFSSTVPAPVLWCAICGIAFNLKAPRRRLRLADRPRHPAQRFRARALAERHLDGLPALAIFSHLEGQIR